MMAGSLPAILGTIHLAFHKNKYLPKGIRIMEETAGGKQESSAYVADEG